MVMLEGVGFDRYKWAKKGRLAPQARSAAGTLLRHQCTIGGPTL